MTGSAFQAVQGPAAVTTKGDLATFDSAVARLPVGTNGQVPMADSAQTKGIKWASLTEADIANLLTDLADLQTQTAFQAAQIAAHLQANAGYRVNSGCAVTVTGAAVGASAARLSLAAGTLFVPTTELNVAAQADQSALASGTLRTVASGSNGVAVNTFAGSGTLNVSSTTGLVSPVIVGDVSGNVAAIVTFTGTSGGNQLTGCTFINAGQSTNFTLATSDTVYSYNGDTALKRWAVVEVPAATGLYALNLGTAATPALIPALTATSVPHRLLYMPPCCCSIDTDITNDNGNAKLIDISELVVVHTARNFAVDTGATALAGTVTTLTTMLNSTKPIPANSLNVGDIYEIEAAGTLSLATGGSDAAMTFVLIFGGVTVFSFLTPTLTKNASGRVWSLACKLHVTAIGASAGVRFAGDVKVSIPGGQVPRALAANESASPAYPEGAIGGRDGGCIGTGGGASSTFDSTAAQVIDCQAKFGTSSTGSTVGVSHFSVVKTPA